MKRILKNSILLLLLVAYIYLYIFFVVKNYLKYSESITAAFVIGLALLSYLFYGYMKDKRTYSKKCVTQIVITQIVVYFVVTYGVGLIVGYLKNSYSLTLVSIIDNMFAPLFLIGATELLRYNYINGNKNNKLSIALLTIAFIFLEMFMSTNKIPINSAELMFKFSTTTIIPLIIKHFVLSYLTYNVGYKPSLLYRIIIDGYVYLVPIAPDLGDYLVSMFGIALPFLVYLYASRFINEYNNGVEREYASLNTTTFRASDLVFIVVFILLAALISGYFPIFMLGVGSASMEPAINIGDAIVAKKVYDEHELKVNDIVVYEGNKRTIVHRISSIEEKDGKTIYHTKGDNNNSVDNIDLTIKGIKGKVLFRIPYIAYPSVFVSNYFEREK